MTGHLVAQPKKGSFFGTHYSDLCWFDDHLRVLYRQHRVVLEMDPAGLQVVAEYDCEAAECTPEHPLLDILVIAVCTLLCGGEGFNNMEDFGEAKHDWLKTFLQLPCGIPTHDTFIFLQ